MDVPLLTAVFVVLLVAAGSYWVLLDARQRTESHRPVVATVAGHTLDRPEVWAVLCLFASVVFLPMYLVARSVGG